MILILPFSKDPICPYIIQNIVFYVTMLFILNYSISKYNQKIKNNKELDKLKNIKSDKFINNFIDEFVSVYENIKN